MTFSFEPEDIALVVGLVATVIFGITSLSFVWQGKKTPDNEEKRD